MTPADKQSDAASEPRAAGADKYASLLQETAEIKGVSLWQDAWRRLRKSKAAMGSLYLLFVTALLAVLTPLLPLQSPIEINLGTRQNLGPNFQSVNLGYRKYQSDLKQLQDKRADAPAENRQAIVDEIERQESQHPLETHWHKPGAITRAMIHVRLAVFGDWCIPSLCGTDNLGRDVLSRIFWGARVSLVVGIVATLVSLVIGVSYGSVAGYMGGKVDAVMMRLVDVLYSVPFIFVVIFIVTILDNEKIKKEWLEPYGINRIFIFYVVIGAIYWLTMSRVVRGQVISLKNEQFVEAARTIGAGRMRIVFRHLVPNVMGIVIVYLTLTIPAVMLFEAFLSFLGLGVAPPDVSWGLLINEGLPMINPIRTYWWLVLFPGLALTMTLFALNFLGDGLRDALDPRMKNR